MSENGQERGVSYGGSDMSGRKHIAIILAAVVAAALLASSVTGFLLSRHYRRIQYEMLDTISGQVLDREPEAEESLMAVLKEYADKDTDHAGEKPVLASWGYRASDFSGISSGRLAVCAAAGLLPGIGLWLGTFWYRNRKEALRIRMLAEYLEQVQAGKAGLLPERREDEFSKLEDEIYKTVTCLYQTKEAAVQAKDYFAENLSNIAHQIKTPVTAISLSLQTMEQEGEDGQTERIRKQLFRLSHLEESLLLLARLDAGTLALKKEEVDVFTLLSLAADNLDEMLQESGTAIDIPEQGEMAVTADLDWTMEAVINLMKNCLEYNPGGTIHCLYEQNPLYTQIQIRDDGKGFAKEDIPHLFQRFYRGKHAAEGGIGIGLSLAKEIIERQNGTIRAENRPEGGACFEIRFYKN